MDLSHVQISSENMTDDPISSTLITGCGQGIGLACFRELLHSPWNDFTIGVTRSKNRSIQELAEVNSSHSLVSYLDVVDSSATSRFFHCLDGGMQIQRAILNAGMRSRLPYEEASLDTFSEVLSVNCLSVIEWTKFLIKRAAQLNHSLNILVVSSIVGTRGFADLSTYATSKSALEGFVRSVAVEYATKNVQINAIAPGFISSSYADSFKHNRPELYQWTLQQTPMARWGSCEEVAKLSCFLIGPDNTYMTGAVIPCDGGWMSK